MLFGFEDHVNKNLATNRSEASSITKKPVEILLSKTSWFYMSVPVLILGIVKASCGLASEVALGVGQESTPKNKSYYRRSNVSGSWRNMVGRG